MTTFRHLMICAVVAAATLSAWPAAAPADELTQEEFAEWHNSMNKEAGAIFIQLRREMGEQWRLHAIRAGCDPNVPLGTDPLPLQARAVQLLPKTIEFPSLEAAAILVAVMASHRGYEVGFTEAMRGVFESGAMDPEQACEALQEQNAG